MSRSWRWFVLATAAVVVALIGANGSVRAERGTDRLEKGEWAEYAGDTRAMKYSPLDQINKNNIKDLRVVWRWRRPM